MQPTTYSVCGINIAAIEPSAAAEALVERGLSRAAFEVHLCNAYTLALVDSDPTLRSALLRADLNLPDGAPLALLGRKAGTKGPVRGPTLVGETVRRGVSRGLRHYFLGGSPNVAKAMCDRLAEFAPGLEVAGIESPPFKPLTDADLDEVARRVTDADAHILWVGLGTPSQDYVVPRLSSRLDLTVVPVGAAFDYWAGSVRQAPAWLHGTGLEWVYRLGTEPQRLWRRYLVGNPRFVVAALRHWLRRE